MIEIDAQVLIQIGKAAEKAIASNRPGKTTYIPCVPSRSKREIPFDAASGFNSTTNACVKAGHSGYVIEIPEAVFNKL